MSNTKLLDKKDFIANMLNTCSHRRNADENFTTYSNYRHALVKLLSINSVEHKLFCPESPTGYIHIFKCSIRPDAVKTIIRTLVENYDETMNMTEDMLVIYYQNILDGNNNPDSKSETYKFDFNRLKESMSSPTILAPSGMSREEKRAFILSHDS